MLIKPSRVFKNTWFSRFARKEKISDKENIDEGELNVFKVRAKDSFSLTDDQINARIKKRTLIEIFKETAHEKI